MTNKQNDLGTKLDRNKLHRTKIKKEQNYQRTKWQQKWQRSKMLEKILLKCCCIGKLVKSVGRTHVIQLKCSARKTHNRRRQDPHTQYKQLTFRRKCRYTVTQRSLKYTHLTFIRQWYRYTVTKHSLKYKQLTFRRKCRYTVTQRSLKYKQLTFRRKCRYTVTQRSLKYKQLTSIKQWYR